LDAAHHPKFLYENSVSKMGFVSPKPTVRKVAPPRVPLKYDFLHVLSTYSQKWNLSFEMLLFLHKGLGQHVRLCK